jgi:hypothetical protein
MALLTFGATMVVREMVRTLTKPHIKTVGGRSMVDRQSTLIVEDDYRNLLSEYLYAGVRRRSPKSNLICGFHVTTHPSATV